LTDCAKSHNLTLKGLGPFLLKFTRRHYTPNCPENRQWSENARNKKSDAPTIADTRAVMTEGVI